MATLLPQKLDWENIVKMDKDARTQFLNLWGMLPEILSDPHVTDACKRLAPALGISWQRLNGRIRLYKKTNDCRALMDRTRAGVAFWNAGLRGVPASLVELYRSLCEQNQRCDKGGWRMLLQIWQTHHDAQGRQWDAIPGYNQWPSPDPKTGIPRGWSFTNLNKLAEHHPWDQKTARVGLAAASEFRPPVITSRAGMRVGERYEIDDHEYNVKVHFPGQSRAMRPRGFNAVDYLSACIFAQSFKPTLWDMEEEKKRALTEVDMMWFTIHILTNKGYRTDERGTTLAVELGTAAIKADLERRIAQATDGHVKVARPGRFGEAAYPGQFHARSKGNFKHKALVEGSFSLVDNYFAALPGQTGLDRLTCPEELHGREQYLKRLLNYAAKEPEQAVDVQLPVLTWTEFNRAALDLYAAINQSPDHDIEGWAELNFEVIEWRLSHDMPWQSRQRLLEYSTEQREAIERVIDDTQSPIPLTQSRKLSRAEVWNAGQTELTRVSPSLWPVLLGSENGRELTVTRQGLFEFEDRDIAPHPLRFLAAVNDYHLTPGETYLAFANPWQPDVLVVCKANGAVLGQCDAWNVPCKSDTEAVLRQVGKQSHWVAMRRERLAARHYNEAVDQAHMIAHNEALMAGKPATAQDRVALKRTNDFAARAEAALDAESNL